jgi:prophage antirepressor-like protein
MSSNESSNSLFPLHYEGRQIRTYVDEDGMAWWVAQDVGNVLGLANVHTSLEGFPQDEKGMHTTYTPGGLQQLITLNEPGLYRLIFHSRKPEAEALKRWVFHDVLPSLRRTGQYTVPGRLPAPERPQREHAEVSTHLLAIWKVMREAEEPLANREIAQRAGVALRTARAHTLYLRHLGLLDQYDIYPRHLFRLASRAQTRHATYWDYLEMLAQIMEERHQRGR